MLNGMARARHGQFSVGNTRDLSIKTRIRRALLSPVPYDMGTHMKITVDISDPLLERAKRLASDRGSTLREVIEAGLRRLLEEERSAKPFVLRDLRVTCSGLQAEFQLASWEQIRDAAYRGRGA
jgi:hypothetical protein